MLRSLGVATAVVNKKPVRCRDYSVELQNSGPALLPAIYRNMHLVALALRDAVVTRNGECMRLQRGDCYIRAAGPGESVTWPQGMHAIYVHLHPRMVRQIGERLLGTSRVSLRPNARLLDATLREIAFELHHAVTATVFTPGAADDLVLALAHHVVGTYAEPEQQTQSVGLLSVETIVDEFRENSATFESVGSLALRAGLSRPHFTRRVRRLTGLSPYHMVLGSRIEAVKHMLERGMGTLSEVAYETGFVDQSHLTRVFRRFTGNTPGAYLASQTSNTR